MTDNPFQAEIERRARLARWHWEWDMNADGAITISDVGPWLEWIFFMPGDGIITLVLAIPSIGTFFEASSESFGNLTSGIMSGILWFVLVVGAMIKAGAYR